MNMQKFPINQRKFAEFEIVPMKVLKKKKIVSRKDSRELLTIGLKVTVKSHVKPADIGPGGTNLWKERLRITKESSQLNNTS